MDATVAQLVERLRMTPLPVEATFFVSTYRSEAETPLGRTSRHGNDRFVL